MKQDTSTGINRGGNYCYYYLHTNGELIHKGKHFDPSDLEESPFVVKWWIIDLDNRIDAYNMLIAASLFGAKKSRIMDLAEHWSITNDDVPNYLKRVGLEWEMDGAAFCVKPKDFVDVQVSNVGFGDSLFEATIQFYTVAVNTNPDAHITDIVDHIHNHNHAENETEDSENQRSE